MDQPGLDPVEHSRALRDLGRINALSRSDSILWPSIAALAVKESRPIRVLDIACGGGDVTVALAESARRVHLDVLVDGCDLSPTAVELAAKRSSIASFFQLDALNEPFPEGYDVVCCSLFLHHLEPEAAISLLGKMAASARRLVLVNDLVRSRFGYGLAWLGCRVLSRSRVVHNDGPASVAAAFNLDEAIDLAERAGLVGATVATRWPARFLMSWVRP